MAVPRTRDCLGVLSHAIFPCCNWICIWTLCRPSVAVLLSLNRGRNKRNLVFLDVLRLVFGGTVKKWKKQRTVHLMRSICFYLFLRFLISVRQMHRFCLSFLPTVWAIALAKKHLGLAKTTAKWLERSIYHSRSWAQFVGDSLDTHPYPFRANHTLQAPHLIHLHSLYRP